MGTLYIDTGGNAQNSGCTDQNAANLSGTAATVAGSVVTLDGSPDLSGLITSGATQSSIYINDATNANMKIFWITAFDNGAKTVTVHAAPTGVVSSTWKIGGRHVLTNATIEGAVRAGDTVIFNNSPASGTGTRWTFRNAGDSTSGPCKIMGKTGVRPVLNTTNAATALSIATALCHVENLEIISGALAINAPSAGWTLVNVKVSSAGTNCLTSTNSGRAIGCEFYGATNHGCAFTGTVGSLLSECYIHDNTQNGILISGLTSMMLSNCIIDSNGLQGVYVSGAHTAANALRITLKNCTVYGNGDSGLEVTDADANVILQNNIFQDNGNAAGEYNVEWVAGAAEYIGYHSNNCFYKSANNLFGLTANSTETTSDPLLTNPASGDFTLAYGSPCKATGTPGTILGTSTGYADMGAIQRLEGAGAPASGGGGRQQHLGPILMG